MTRTRKHTRSAAESFRLVSDDGLDIAGVHPLPNPLVNTTLASESRQKHRSRPSFQRLFSRTRHDENAQGVRSVSWPFSRSPRKNSPPAGDEHDSPYPITSPAVASTSSLGSVVPIEQLLFSPVMLTSSAVLAQDTAVIPPDAFPPQTIIIESTLNDARSFEGTEASQSMVLSEPDDDPTRTAPPRPRRSAQRLSLVVPPRDPDVFSLRPAIGVAPHAPSETESSLCSPTSPTSPGPRPSSPTFPPMRSSCVAHSPPHVPSSEPPNPRLSAPFPDVTSPSHVDSSPPSGAVSAGHRMRAMSRSMTPPPCRPPPKGPLPALPSSSIPPVPPLPPLLSKMSPGAVSSHRPAIAGVPPIPSAALPPSPPGGLRLPSRLSWINGVRAVLPSPPASPTRQLKSLATKTSLPLAPPKAEKRRSTSIGVIEATDTVQVRRTKSILLLGSKSKSNASLGTKRVHIHTDVNADGNGDASRKPRRKSSSATVGGHPTLVSDPGPGMRPVASAELLVPRERRHSAPILSALDAKISAPSADWTLSLPFCTDLPGNQIGVSPPLEPRVKSEGGVEELENEEDWTLCMPLKMRPGTPIAGTATEECDSSAGIPADSSKAVELLSAATQLPTPSPSPGSASFVRPLEAEEEEEEQSESIPEEQSRPASPVETLGPHVGGLDLAGGRGKRASAWHVYGWFDDVNVAEDDSVRPAKVTAPSRPPSFPDSVSSGLTKSHVMAFRKAHDGGRGASQDSITSTVSTVFYSARSSLVN